MDRNIPRWQLTGFVFVSALGTFLHFLFDLTGSSVIAAPFSAVNESIWEHLKLLYFPMLLFALLEYFVWGRFEAGFWQVKCRGIFLGLTLIPILYYTYTGISGVNADWLNITIFFVAAAAVYYRETKLFGRSRSWGLPGWICGVLIALWGVLFILFTFFPPAIPFFRDPLSGTYGFNG